MKKTVKKYQKYILLILKISGIETAFIIIASLLNKSENLIPNLYFFGSAILLLIGIFPLWSASTAKRLDSERKNGLVIDKNPEDINKISEDKLTKLQNSISFSIAGMISFILSILTSN